jgi:hypothetical protein
MITAVPGPKFHHFDPLCIGSRSFYQQVTIKNRIKSPFGQTILRSKVTLPRPIQRAQRFVVTTELPQSENYTIYRLTSGQRYKRANNYNKNYFTEKI